MGGSRSRGRDNIIVVVIGMMDKLAPSSKPDNSVYADSRVETGRKTAILRVRQRQKRESLRWSPSGRLRRPHSRQQRQQQQSCPSIINIPWNDRFNFDDGSQHKGATQSRDRQLSSRRGRKEKENFANSNSEINKIRYFAERSDGDLVVQFHKMEVSTPDGEKSSVTETRNINTSPFNMVEVSAALKDTMPQEMECILDQFEELILTMEIEEELMRRDLENERMKVSSTKDIKSSKPKALALPNEGCNIARRNKDNHEKAETALLDAYISSISEEIETILQQTVAKMSNKKNIE